MPGKEGMVHISEVSDEYLEDITKVLKEGQLVTVKLLDIDEVGGRYKLTMKKIPQPGGEAKPKDVEEK